MPSVNWSTEWLQSLLWVLGVWALVVIGFALVGWFLIRRTRWGRQFWRLSGMYFIPRHRGWVAWRPILTVALLLMLTVASVRLDVLLSYQGNGLLTAMQRLDAPAFWKYIGIFGILAAINVVLVLFTFWVSQAQIIHWRLWLNQRMAGDWLSGTAYYRMRFVSTPVDNPDQRIQQDVTSFTSDSQSLGLGAVSSCVGLVSFTVILWQLSGPITVFGLQIPRAMVFLAFVYVIIATVFAFRIGRPLIRLNFLNELLTASYRYALVRIRDNSENIAFYRGEQVENGGLMDRFAAVIANTWAIVYRSLKFQGFNLIISQIAVIFPYVIQAPRFFSQQITLGDVNQTAAAFGQVEGALSFFRLAYDDFASYRASLNRLTGLLDANDEARALPVPVTEDRSTGLGVNDLDVRLPNGQPLLTDLDLNLAGGDSLLRWCRCSGPRAAARRPCCAASPACGRMSTDQSSGRWMERRCSAASSPTSRRARCVLRWRTHLLPRRSATMSLSTHCVPCNSGTWQTGWTWRPTGPGHCRRASSSGWRSVAF